MVANLVGQSEYLNFEAKTCSIPFSSADKDHRAENSVRFRKCGWGVSIYGLVAKAETERKEFLMWYRV
jgi:hypothetical protein